MKTSHVRGANEDDNAEQPGNKAVMSTKQILERLFDLAANNLAGSNITSSLAKGKAFELYALAVVLRAMRKAGFTVTAIAPPAVPTSQLRFAGGPANADKSKYTHFSLARQSVRLEAWVSVEVQTLSTELEQKSSGATYLGLASYHELDIAVFTPLQTYPHRPTRSEVTFAASCKDTGFKKEFVREALGLRRETAYLTNPNPSLAPWFISSVPARPAVPVVLFSRDSQCSNYAQPVDSLGVYVRQLLFP